MTKIFIDPGHGGHDPGAVANGLQEKNIVLDIAKRIERLLQDYEGVQVKLSRSDDRFLELTERARLANQWGADYFVSIHINAGGGTGYEDFIYSGSVSSATVANQNIMNAEIVKSTGFANRGKKRGNLAVLRTSNMPAILTENGFIDNTSDAQLLKQSSFLDKVAQGHVNGLVKIFGLKKKGVSNVSNQTVSDWAKNSWEKAVKAEIFDGTNPKEPLTREQFAVILDRLGLLD